MKKKKAEKIIDAVGFPKEAVLSLPTITISLGSEVSIVNYGGIIDYDDNFISFSTGRGVVEISGKDFTIKSITDEDITLAGEIEGLRVK